MAEKKAARRARGEGTIYYDEARGRWVGAVKIAGRRRKVTGKDKTEARSKLANLLAAKHTDTPVPSKTLTVESVLATFLERDVASRTRGGRPLAPATIGAYRWAARIITDEIGKARIAELGPDDIEAMLDRLSRRDTLSAASLVKIRSVLRQALAFAVRRGDAVRNAAEVATITPSAAKRRPRRSLTPDQARTLLVALGGERLGAMYALMLQAGLRPGEAAGVYWSDLHGHVVSITRGVRLDRGRAEVTDDLKTATARRSIELPADLVDRIAAHRTAQATEILAATTWLDRRLMFASPRGAVLSPPNVRRDLRRILAAADLPPLSPNELRHSCASLLSDQGVSNEQIADLLGHTTTRMVDQTYRHRLRPVVDIAARADWRTASEH
ncbi:MAG: site-specific integrase [Actinomycetota bacterium]